MVTCEPVRSILGAADRHDEVLIGRTIEGVAVEDLVLQHDHRIGIANRRPQQPLGVGRRPWRDHLQPRHMRVPTCVALRVLRADPRRRAVGAAEHDRAAHLAARHVQCLGRGVDDLVHRLHGEIEGHELDDRPQPVQRRAHRHAGEAVLGDRRVDHALGTELVQQALADFVGALILRDLLADQEHIGVAAHLQRHGVAQRLAHGDRLGWPPVLLGGGVRLGGSVLWCHPRSRPGTHVCVRIRDTRGHGPSTFARCRLRRG